MSILARLSAIEADLAIIKDQLAAPAAPADPAVMDAVRQSVTDLTSTVADLATKVDGVVQEIGTEPAPVA